MIDHRPNNLIVLHVSFLPERSGAGATATATATATASKAAAVAAAATYLIHTLVINELI